LAGGASWLAALALAGCSDPSWRDPATSKGSAAVAPEVLKVLSPRAGTLNAASSSDSAEAPPPTPTWAAGLMNQPIGRAFPDKGVCLGNTDGVKLRYHGGAGVRLAGWGWDPRRRAPVEHVLVAGPDGLIAGAGESGTRRLDVPRVLPDVTSDTTGWEAVTWRSAGPIDVFGVLADGHTLCGLGHLAL
jgi:hypothetical protein